MAGSRDEVLSVIRDALRNIEVPTDTMITDDIPLLLTKLAGVPPVEPLVEGDDQLR